MPGKSFFRLRIGIVLQLQALLALAISLGGGGVAYGLHNLAIQLFALTILAMNRGAVVGFARNGPRWLLVLVIVTMALPLIQLVPLPSGLWQALPGRELVVASFAVLGLEEGQWFPVSVDRARTLVAFCGTLAPATMIVLGSMLVLPDRLRLVRTFIVLALAALLLGIVQLGSANSFGLLYPITSKPDVLYATFANRNSTGLLFVLALALLVASPIPHRREWLLASVGAGSILAVGVIITQSRSSMVLLAIVLAFTAFRVVSTILKGRRGARPVVNPAGILAGVAGLGILLAILGSAAMGGRAADSFERFTQGQTDRPEMWEDGIYAAQAYWPVGSGMGTFDEVFQVYESLEYVSPRRAGRAHNDFIEIAIEGGIFTLLLSLVWLGWSARAALGNSLAGAKWLNWGAGVGIGCIALQSLLDYPLRNQSLLCAAALLIVLLAPLPRDAT
ncbi:O-antigen ligase family protein [Aurantiacibacter atlanticus]|nr:O-antigen ligase family protein [Aurantiacibacter atlanticus]